MATMLIRLQVDPATGKKDLWIDYHSDADALPVEHEEEHRAVVEKLLAGGIISQSELGRIIVTRGGEQASSEGVATSEPVLPRSQKA